MNPNLRGEVKINNKPIDEYIRSVVGTATAAPAAANKDMDLVKSTLQEITSNGGAQVQKLAALEKSLDAVKKESSKMAQQVMALEAEVAKLKEPKPPEPKPPEPKPPEPKPPEPPEAESVKATKPKRGKSIDETPKE